MNLNDIERKLLEEIILEEIKTDYFYSYFEETIELRKFIDNNIMFSWRRREIIKMLDKLGDGIESNQLNIITELMGYYDLVQNIINTFAFKLHLNKK